MPASMDLVGAEIELVNHPNREKILKNPPRFIHRNSKIPNP
jgi:hypothetical protein